MSKFDIYILEKVLQDKLNLHEEIETEEEYQEIKELVNLLSLTNDECEERFLLDKSLFQKYFPKNTNETAKEDSRKEPKPEEVHSDSEEVHFKHQVEMNRSYTETGRKRQPKAVKFSIPHNGIHTGISYPIHTKEIQSLKIRREIKKWNNKINLIFQSNKDKFFIFLYDYKSKGIIKNKRN